MYEIAAIVIIFLMALVARVRKLINTNKNID